MWILFKQHHFGCSQRECKANESIIDQKKRNVRITNLCYSRRKATRVGEPPKSASRDDVNWQTTKTEQLYKVSIPCFDDHNYKKEELDTVGELSDVCSQIVLKCLYQARIGTPDILWSVNKLTGAVTKWTGACDRRLARLISYIHYSIITQITIDNLVMWVIQFNTADWVYLKTLILLDTLKSQK